MSYKRVLTFFLLGLMLVVALFTGACAEPEATPPTREQEAPTQETSGTIKLRYGELDPETHPNAGVTKAWLEKIEDESNGRVQVEAYFGGTLISAEDGYEEIQSKVADMGKIIADYQKTGFDLHKMVPQFLLGASDPETSINVYKDLRATFPEFDKEFENVRLLNIVYAGSPYQLLTKKPIRSVEDLKGLQLKGLDFHIDPFKKLGVSIITMSMFDAYTAIEKGTIDGLLAPLDVLKALNMADVVDYVTLVNLPSYLHSGLSMNIDTWNSLPPDIQKVFEDNSGYYTEQFLKVDAQSTKNAIDHGKEMGVEFSELPEEELNKIYDVMRAKAREKAEELDAKGLPGTEVFEEAQRLIAEKYN